MINCDHVGIIIQATLNTCLLIYIMYNLNKEELECLDEIQDDIKKIKKKLKTDEDKV